MSINQITDKISLLLYRSISVHNFTHPSWPGTYERRAALQYIPMKYYLWGNTKVLLTYAAR